MSLRKTSVGPRSIHGKFSIAKRLVKSPSTWLFAASGPEGSRSLDYHFETYVAWHLSGARMRDVVSHSTSYGLFKSRYFREHPMACSGGIHPFRGVHAKTSLFQHKIYKKHQASPSLLRRHHRAPHNCLFVGPWTTSGTLERVHDIHLPLKAIVHCWVAHSKWMSLSHGTCSVAGTRRNSCLDPPHRDHASLSILH